MLAQRQTNIGSIYKLFAFNDTRYVITSTSPQQTVYTLMQQETLLHIYHLNRQYTLMQQETVLHIYHLNRQYTLMQQETVLHIYIISTDN